MSNPKLYIFDIDGTLTNTTKVDDTCFIRTFVDFFELPKTERSAEMDFSTFEHVTDWGITTEWVKRVKNRAISTEEFNNFKQVFLQDLRKAAAQDKTQFSEVLGAADFIDYLQQQDNSYLAIATGAWGDSARIKLQNGGIPFEGIPISHADKYISRAAITLDAIEQAKSLYGIDFQDMTYFGDGAWDYKTCRNLGIPFVGIDCNGNGKLKALGAEEVYGDWEEVRGSFGKKLIFKEKDKT